MNIICGINPVLEALTSGTRHFDRLLVAKGLRNRRVSEAVRLASQKGVPLRFETRETLDRMAGDVPHQGLVGVVSVKPVMSLESLMDEARAPQLVVVLDGVEDPRNLGAILRTAEAAGADGVLLPERHTAGLSETVARASAGGLEHVKVARVGNVVQALEALKERGLWVVGYDAAGSERWEAVDYRRPIALVFGGEDRGIRRLVREKCDHVAALPLFGHVGSLNVSVVAGIALYEVIRQRGSVPSHVRPIPSAAAPRRGADEETASLVRVEDHEATAWSHPSVLRNVGPHGGKRRARDDRRLFPRPRGGPSLARAAGEPGGRDDAHRRKRKRRRRKGPRGGPPDQRPAGLSRPTEQAQDEAARAPGGDGGAPQGPERHPGPPAAQRRGRRRGRRRRRPPAPPGR